MGTLPNVDCFIQILFHEKCEFIQNVWHCDKIEICCWHKWCCSLLFFQTFFPVFLTFPDFSDFFFSFSNRRFRQRNAQQQQKFVTIFPQTGKKKR
jgi:hypothetical protein